MKILLVHNFHKNRGGEDLYVLALEKLLKKNGHSVLLYSRDNKEIKDNLLNKVKVALGLFFNRSAKQEFRKILFRFKPDLVHVHNIYPLITPLIYKECKMFKIPVVQTLHDYKLLCPGAFFYSEGKECVHIRKKNTISKIFNKCYKKSYLGSIIYTACFFYHFSILKSYENIDYFVFPAVFARNIHESILNLPREKLYVLPYYFEGEKIGKNLRRNKNHFLFVGRLSEEKGIIQLLNIFSSLPYMKLIVIGNGPLKEELKKFKKFKNISIQHNASRGDIFRFMTDAFFTIIPSIGYETGPKVMIESFAMGTPVIVPKKGVFKEIVKDWRTGVFFKYNNKDDLREKILNVWENKERVKQMENTVRKFFDNSRYREEEHYRELIKIYRSQIISQR